MFHFKKERHVLIANDSSCEMIVKSLESSKKNKRFKLIYTVQCNAWLHVSGGNRIVIFLINIAIALKKGLLKFFFFKAAQFDQNIVIIYTVSIWPWHDDNNNNSLTKI